MFILSRWILKTGLLALFALPLGIPVAFAQAQAAPVKLAMIEGLSGPNGNAGEAVFRNLNWAVERVNARGGVKLPAAAGGNQTLVLERYDSKGQNEEALSALRSAIDNGARIVLQGNSSANAAALIDAINKHNEREPSKRVLFLNYSAVAWVARVPNVLVVNANSPAKSFKDFLAMVRARPGHHTYSSGATSPPTTCARAPSSSTAPITPSAISFRFPTAPSTAPR